MLNCWIQWYLLAILSRFIYISVNVLQKQSFQIFFYCFCLVFDSKLRLDVFLWLLQINQIITVILHWFWSPGRAFGYQHQWMVPFSWCLDASGQLELFFWGGDALKLARELGIIGSSNIPTELWYWVRVARYVESSRREWSEIVLADVMSAFNVRMALDHSTLLNRRS